MDSGSRSSLQTDEETHREAANADRTKGKGGSNRVLSRGQRSYQCSLNDRKGGQANANVLCEPRPTRAGDQLHPHGKTSVSLAQRKQAAEKILSGTHNCCSHRSANKATAVKLRNCWKDAKVEIHGSGAGLYAKRFRFEATNNEAEYEALIAGLRIAEQMGMVQFLEKVKTLTSKFKEFSIKQVPRSENKKANALSKIASTSFAHLSKQVLVEELKEKSINKKEVLAIVEEEGHTWMTPICEYLTKEILPKDKKTARVVRRKVSRFGLPVEIVSDSGKQFHDNPFKDWACQALGLRSRLNKNDEALEIILDLTEEKREKAAIQEAESKAKMEKYYNSKVRGTSFKPGDMVYRSNDASHAKDGGKLGPKWEGPYEVTKSLGKGAYKLKDRKGNELPRTWNICNLKKCYIHEV
ncbi:reverse transcriptase domain-containing protein [Tanacetum coccineum]